MSEMDKGKKLFEEFPPVSTEQWEEKIIKDLKGADYERKLIWRTNEGFNVRPYYRQEDLEKVNYLDVKPNEYPFVRGVNANKNRWFIRQDIEVTQFVEANAKAVELYSKGVDAFGFIMDADTDYTKDQIAALLKEIPLTEVEVNFVAGYGAFKIVEALKQYFIDEGIDITKIKGSVAFDPVMCIAKKGEFKTKTPLNDAAEMVKLTADMPQFKAITVSGSVFENAGSSIVQELGFGLSVASEYMAGLIECGISANKAADGIKFEFATGSNYFMEIAKIRAARLLWAKIAKAYGTDEDKCLANIHAVTSDWNKTIYDPYVNMLRTQTEAMSAVLGGVNSMTVKAYNTTFEKPNKFSDRIARNQQILLKEEAHFDKVVDPGAGSYYIETLTDNIAEQAWALFSEVEEKGGFVKAYRAGFVQKTINQMAQKRDQDIANRKEILLGVNQYPNFSEHAEIEMSSNLLEKAKVANTEFEPLIPYRGAMAFEAMRYKTDVYSKNNKRPLAFMLTMGNLNMRKARAQFACNFFAVAGFNVQDNNGFDTVDEGMAAAEKAKADIIVICSSDEEYAQLAPEVKQKVGDKIVVVAGYPKAIMDDLKAAGIEHFIHVKCNVLDTLTGFQKELGIE